MSADNFVGVRDNGNGTFSVFEYGNMSQAGEDCQYLKDKEGIIFNSRAAALVAAHDLVKEMYVCEYGVVEMNAPTDPCGQCWTCVHERGIVSDDLPRCDFCQKPISASEWMVQTSGGTYHNNCEKRKTFHPIPS